MRQSNVERAHTRCIRTRRHNQSRRTGVEPRRRKTVSVAITKLVVVIVGVRDIHGAVCDLIASAAFATGFTRGFAARSSKPMSTTSVMPLMIAFDKEVLPIFKQLLIQNRRELGERSFARVCVNL